MASTQNQITISNEDEEFLRTMRMADGLILSMVLKAAIELDLFELINKVGPNAKLSSTEIASLLQTKNPEAPIMLDRILRFLASQSYLKCTQINDDEDGHTQILLYELAPKCKHFIRNPDGVSLAPLALIPLDKVFVNSWFHLKDAILEGGVPFDRAYGMHAFEYPRQDSRFNDVFNKGMYNHTTLLMKRILQVYNGFEGVINVIDVGGGIGASLACIVSKYPNIKGINYDLPHVIKDAPPYPGVEHVEGDMFVSVPSGDVIFMKWILHDWSDDHCLKLLKNCWMALPDCGKVIVVEQVLPEYPENDFITGSGFADDMIMMTVNPGGKERRHREFEALVTAAGFASLQLVCRAYNYWIMEVYKESRSSNDITL